MAGDAVTVLNYTSAIIPSIVTGSGTTNELAYFTASTVISSLTTATYPSLTELSYVKGVTSSIQTQLNGKQGTITLTTTGTNGAATLVGATLNIPNYADGGVLSLSAIGGTPNANAATITGTVLNLQPANASFGGVVTTGTQTFAGDKTLTGNSVFENNDSGNPAVRFKNQNGSGITAQWLTSTNTVGGYIYNNGLISTTPQGDLYGSAIDSFNSYQLNQSLTDPTGTGSAVFSVSPTFTGVPIFGSSISNGTYTYTLPSATGTLALTSALSSYLPLVGGTLTGALNGTSATFSGIVTTNGTSAFSGYGLTTKGTYGLWVQRGATNDSGVEVYHDGTNAIISSTYQSTGSFGGMMLYTGGSPRLTLASTGAATFSNSVGIGGGIPSIFTPYSVATFGSLSSTNNGITIASTTAGSGLIEFADGSGGGSASYRGYIQYAHTSDSLIFGTASSDRLTIASTGNVGIGTASPANLLNIEKSSNSGSGSTFPRLAIKNTLATQGDGSSTFNFADILVSSGNESVNMFLATTYAAGTWAPAAIINVSTNHDLQIKTNNLERIRITSDAYLRMAASTGGIQFNGDTAAANALDDYEEGGWTPSYTGAGTPTYSVQFGKYTKIGNIVYCTISLKASGVSGVSGINIIGLPFSSADASDNGQRSTYNPRLGGHISGLSEATAKFRTNTNSLTGVKGDLGTTIMTAVEFSAGGSVEINGSFWYYV